MVPGNTAYTLLRDPGSVILFPTRKNTNGRYAMKRNLFLPILLTAVLILSLSACGSKDCAPEASSSTVDAPSVSATAALASDSPAVTPSSAPAPSMSVQDQAADAYMRCIQEIKQTAEGTEQGKLRCSRNNSRSAWDGEPQRALYDRYCFIDLDSDGVDELVMLYTDESENELNVIEVLTYSTESKSLKPVSKCFTLQNMRPEDMVFFSNGTIALSHSGNEEPTYFFPYAGAAGQYDFSGTGQLSGNLLQFHKEMDSQGNMTLTEMILGAFDVSASRNVSVDEANQLLSQIESGTNLKPTLISFIGDSDIVAGQYY